MSCFLEQEGCFYSNPGCSTHQLNDIEQIKLPSLSVFASCLTISIMQLFVTVSYFKIVQYIWVKVKQPVMLPQCSAEFLESSSVYNEIFVATSVE